MRRGALRALLAASGVLVVLTITRGRGFPDGTLLVTTWGGELLALPAATG